MATSRILGPDGQPIQTPELATPQTAHLTALQRELQSHPTRGLTPSRLAHILDAAENGDLTAQFELFEDMEEKDGHIAAEMGKRRRACVLDWDVVPPEGADAAEKKIAAQLEGDRTAISGVNLDEEAAKLLQYQQAYQAAAKTIQVAQNIFDTLLQTMR